jgi:formylglycine-generating enzyme required for sulfatase activity
MLAANLAALPERMRGMQWRAVAAAAGILVCASAAAIYLFSPASVPVKRTQLAGKDSVPSSPRPTFKDCNVCPEMVELPAGDFMMGSPESEYGRQPADGPQRHVAIAKRFAIGRLEVTVDQFEAFVADTGLAVENVCHKSVGVNQWAPAKGSFRQPGFDVTGSHPAVCVSWYDAQAYAAWLGRRTGRPYRLPSEAEWEYAARAGTTSAYSFGNDEGQLCEYARFGDLSSSFVFRGACRSEIVAFGAFPVGKLRPNPWGLFDMHGNAWEWVADCWISDVQKMPIDGMAFTRPGGCEVGVLRGGAWATGPRWVRSAHRIPIPVADRRYHVGFRVALSLGP